MRGGGAVAALLLLQVRGAASFVLPTRIVAGVSSCLHLPAIASASVSARRAHALGVSAMSCSATYEELCSKLRKISRLEGCMGLMGWDEQTMMPTGAEQARAHQKAALAGVVHDAKVDPAIGELLSSLSGEAISGLSPAENANIREARKSFERNGRISTELASKMAQLESEGYGAWVRAREANDFEAFKPVLSDIIDLRKQILAKTKPEMDLYDAAVDDFDPNMQAARLAEIFDAVKKDLTPLIKKITSKSGENPALLEVKPALRGGPDWDPAKQAALCEEIAKEIGFDFDRGRMDVSVHPFTGGSHPSDVRITTRYSADNWIEGIAGTIHECGHAMYEQGRSSTHADLPVSEALGMATHESQSLLWERMVGQSRAFWVWATPIVHKYFPHTAECTAEDFYRAVNIVRPSLIRVDADEVTYPLHVMVRFELERGIFDGSVALESLPKAWDDKMETYLGVRPPSNKEGVLQDVHWSGGAFGYFPSYSLGAMIATQLFAKAKTDIPELEAKIAAGQFKELKQWLNTHIHESGCTHPSADALLEAVCAARRLLRL